MIVCPLSVVRCRRLVVVVAGGGEWGVGSCYGAMG